MTWLHRFTLDAPQPVAKHPGHGDQAVHSPRKGGGAGASDWDEGSRKAAEKVGMAYTEASAARQAIGSTYSGEPPVYANAKSGARRAVSELGRATEHMQNKSIPKAERVSRARASIERGKIALNDGKGKSGGAISGVMLERMNRIGSALNAASQAIAGL